MTEMELQKQIETAFFQVLERNDGMLVDGPSMRKQLVDTFTVIVKEMGLEFDAPTPAIDVDYKLMPQRTGGIMTIHIVPLTQKGLTFFKEHGMCPPDAELTIETVEVTINV